MEVEIGIKVGNHLTVMTIGVSHREDGTMMMMIGSTKVGVNRQAVGGIVTHMIHRGANGDLVKPIKEVEIGDGEALVRAARMVEAHRGAMTGDGIQANLERAVDLVGDGVQERQARDHGVEIIGDLERLGKDGEVTVVDGIVIIGVAEDGVVIRYGQFFGLSLFVHMMCTFYSFTNQSFLLYDTLITHRLMSLLPIYLSSKAFLKSLQ